MSHSKRRTPIHNVLLHTLVLFAVLGPSLCGCNDEPAVTARDIVESDFSGTWTGSTSADKTVLVDLTRESDGDHILHYSTPYNYKLTLEKSGSLEDGSLTLRIKGTNNGRSLWQAKVILTMPDKNHKNQMVATIEKEGSEAADLKKYEADLKKKD